MDIRELNEEFERLRDDPNRSADEGIAKLRAYFKHKTKEEALMEMRGMHDADLDWLCTIVALPTEDYEICALAHQVLKERQLSA